VAGAVVEFVFEAVPQAARSTDKNNVEIKKRLKRLNIIESPFSVDYNHVNRWE
jgi:hypothetical protein